MPQHTARIINSDGSTGRLKIRRIREHEAAGAGKWIDGTFHFNREERAIQAAPRVRHSPVIGRITSRLVDSYSGHDSGFSLLPYPQTSRLSALARPGAGL